MYKLSVRIIVFLEVAPVGVADRVNLGLVPSCEGGWAVACRALKPNTGGWLHVHGNVSSKARTADCSLLSINHSEGNPWEKSSIKVNEQSTFKKADDKLKQKPSPADTRHDQEEIDCIQREQLGSRTTLDSNQEEKESYLKHTTSENVEACGKQDVWEEWACYVAGIIAEMLPRENPLEVEQGNEWTVTIGHLEHVKSYAPHVDHLVVDLECKPTWS